jgi:hypothetical protein
MKQGLKLLFIQRRPAAPGAPGAPGDPGAPPVPVSFEYKISVELNVA